ncbi:hypothetical protein Tco_0730485 [Tanacetum coccineum]|uniref:Uncharacterized protein n=1 Tax=Tanacetum coccineum TaxID=301880 RepID=A0ABQ4YRX4_9ASTR
MLDKGDVNIRELVKLIKDMVYLLDSASVFCNANAEGENVQEEQPSVQESTSSEQVPLITEQIPPGSTALVVHASKEKASEEKVSKEEPPFKILNSHIASFKQPHLSTLQRPPKDESKGKGIATENNPLKELIPLIDEGGSAPKMQNLGQFSSFGIHMSIEDARAQLEEMKRLNSLKVKKEES